MKEHFTSNEHALASGFIHAALISGLGDLGTVEAVVDDEGNRTPTNRVTVVVCPGLVFEVEVRECTGG